MVFENYFCVYKHLCLFIFFSGNGTVMGQLHSRWIPQFSSLSDGGAGISLRVCALACTCVNTRTEGNVVKC